MAHQQLPYQSQDMEYQNQPMECQSLDMEYLDQFIACQILAMEFLNLPMDYHPFIIPNLDMVYQNLFTQFLWLVMVCLNLSIIQCLQLGMEYLNLFIMSAHFIQPHITLCLILNQDMEYLNLFSMILLIPSTLSLVDYQSTLILSLFTQFLRLVMVYLNLFIMDYQSNLHTNI